MLYKFYITFKVSKLMCASWPQKTLGARTDDSLPSAAAQYGCPTPACHYRATQANKTTTAQAVDVVR